MIRQIPYYNPISADNALYSIDNLKIILQARENFAEGLRLDDNYFNTIFPFAKSHGISHRNNEYYQTYNKSTREYIRAKRRRESQSFSRES